MDQVTTYAYNLDDSLASTGFTNETIATPDISHTYDPHYPRPLTMVDGNGTTTYSYVAPGTNGALQLSTVNGPLTDDTINYAYDELGRVLTRMLNGTGTEFTYDTLGRLSQLEFPIGAFDYTYVGHTGRRAGVTYPNGQTTTYSYLDDEHDFRLQTTHHKNPSAATLSKFDYTYDTIGNILTWRQERAGSAAKKYTFTHDLVDQLTSAVLSDTNTNPTILKRQAWAYDAMGNRTVDQTDDAVFSTSHDAMNRLQSRSAGGAIAVEGSLNEPATVTIDGKPAAVDGSNQFRGTATLTGAVTTVTVKARDASGNETAKQYEVDAAGATASYIYDANGNLTSDGAQAYSWNALNQLVQVKEGTTTIATFEYDGKRRRTKKTAAGAAHVYIYDAEDTVEERISGSNSDTIRYYHGAGIDQPLARKNSSEVVAYYLADHLGSIVQETNASGAVTLEREYDPWGVATQGASTSGHAFTGREWDAETGLLYSRARYYDPDSGRFISQDPLGFGGGRNFYDYVGSGPITRIDPTGLSWSSNVTFLLNWLAGSAATNESMGPSYPQTKEMASSPGAQRLRDAFEANDCKDVQAVEYSTPRAAWDTLLNLSTAAPSSTSAQVGGFMGKARNNGNGTVTYVIENTAGTRSFLYHQSPNREGNGPMRTVRQTFFWTEPTNCPK
jgi:RHS repeat-associated protein